MDTASRQDWLIGFTRSGRPVYQIAGAEGEGGSGDPGSGGSGDPKDPPKKGNEGDPPAKEFKPIESQDELDRIVGNRIARERSKYPDYDELKKKAEEFDKLQDSQKSELEKASEAKSAAEQRAQAAELKALRLEVAAERGLTPAQAKRLDGKTKEELEADADELLESFKPNGKTGDKPPSRRPGERLSGGADPSEEPDERDPKKLVEGLPSIM